MSLLKKSLLMLRSQRVWLVPVALTVLGFGGATKVSAQTTYPFSGYYDTTVIVKPITSDISQVMESGESTDAGYGLNQYKGLTYSQTNSTTGELSFNIDPTTFGLQDLPVGYIKFGSGTNKLFGTSDAYTKIDFENLTSAGYGTVAITGGEGIFKNASGTLLFTETDKISQDGNNFVLRGLSLVSGPIETLQTVPEPGNTTTLIGLGVIGCSFLLRRHRLLADRKL